MVVLRRRIKEDLVPRKSKAGEKAKGKQLALALDVAEVLDKGQLWEYTVLVTNAPYEITA